MTPNNVMIGVLCASPSTFHPLVCLSDLVSKTNDNVILKVAHGLTQKCKFRVKMTLSAKHMDLHGFHMDFIPASKNPKGQAHPTKQKKKESISIKQSNIREIKQVKASMTSMHACIFFPSLNDKASTFIILFSACMHDTDKISMTPK